MKDPTELKIKDPLTQGDLELWLVCIRNHTPKGANQLTLMAGNLPLPEHYGVAVRGATDAGWFDDKNFKASDVGDMSPKAVRQLGQKVWEAYMEATSFDPNE